MGFFSHGIERSELVAGDHIYAWRTAYIYSHHGIYIGEGKVVHFTSDASSSVGSLSSTSISGNRASGCPNSVPDCGFRQAGHGVLLSCLDCFLHGDSLCRYEYDVPRYRGLFKRGGTYTTEKSDPPEEVVYRTRYLLEKGCFGVYNLGTNNCENFALYCKTGLIRDSGQIVEAEGLLAGATPPMGLLRSLFKNKPSGKVPVEVLSSNRRNKQ